MVRRLFLMGFKKVFLFVVLVCAELLAGGVAVGMEGGLRADALGADGIYYGEASTILMQAGKIKLPVPQQLIVLPDGNGLISSTRLYTGTLTIPVRGSWKGNWFRGVAKPSYRFGPMLAKTIEMEATYLKSSKKLIVQSKVISEGIQGTNTFYKAGTPEGKRYQS